MVDLLDDGPEIAIKSDFFTAGESTYIFEQLKAQISWRQETMRFGRREVLQPGMTERPMSIPASGTNRCLGQSCCSV